MCMRRCLCTDHLQQNPCKNTYAVCHLQVKNAFGTVRYSSPEMANDICGQKSDIWSVGVVMYILLSGKAPFLKTNDTDTLNLIKSGPRVRFTAEKWAGISQVGAEKGVKVIGCWNNGVLRIGKRTKQQEANALFYDVQACKVSCCMTCQGKQCICVHGCMQAAKDCIRSMLEPSHEARPTAADILQMPWLKAHVPDTVIQGGVHACSRSKG